MSEKRLLLAIVLVGALVILASWLWPIGEPGENEVANHAGAAAPASPVAAVEPSAEVSEARLEVVSPEAITDASNGVPVHGRVLGVDRRPVASASLILGFSLGEPREIESGADGSFSTFFPRPAEQADLFSVIARHALGVGSHRAYLRDGGLELDLGDIVLEPAHPLRVRVMQDGAAAGAAEVTLETVDRFVRLFTTVTDVFGEAYFETAPEGNLIVHARKADASGIARAFLPGDEVITVKLAPERDYEIHVLDAEEETPIAGAVVTCDHQVWIPAGEGGMFLMMQSSGDFVMVRPDPARTTRTDEEGIAWIRGVGARDSVGLTVTAEGYPEPSEPVRLGDEPVVQVRMSRPAGRTVRWPVIAGEMPPPRHGTELKIRFVPGVVDPREVHVVPGPASIDRGAVVLEGVNGVAHFLAAAPDGAIAKLFCAANASEGDPVTFRRPRSIKVTVRDAADRLVEGARVTARNQGNNELQPPVPTNRDGLAVISGLYGGLASVWVLGPGDVGRGRECGTVDLEQGDGRLEARLPSDVRIRLRLRLDGVPGLPPSYRVSTRGGCRVESEDPERGEILVSVPVDEGFSGALVLSVQAAGFLGGRAEVVPGQDGSETVADVLLRRAGTLLVHVVRDPADSVRIGLEKQDPSNGEVKRIHSTLMIPNGPRGSFRFILLENGTYRAVDERTKNVSAFVQVVEGSAAAEVTLDVASADWVSGRVITPPGVSPRTVRIVVEGDGLLADAPSPFGWSSPPGEYVVQEDGTFRVRIPGDRRVTISPWHATCQPAPYGGTVETTRGLDGVELHLVEGLGVVIPAPQLEGVGRQGLRVGVKVPGAAGLRWFHAAYEGGAIRFGTRPPHGVAPGRHTLTLEPGSRFAPLVLPEVEIGAGLTELDPVTFEPGATLRVQILTRAGSDPPRIYVSARHIEEPDYLRLVNSNGEGVVELTGLGPGRFQVSASKIMAWESRLEREFATDGKSDLTMVLDLR